MTKEEVKLADLKSDILFLADGYYTEVIEEHEDDEYIFTIHDKLHILYKVFSMALALYDIEPYTLLSWRAELYNYFAVVDRRVRSTLWSRLDFEKQIH